MPSDLLQPLLIGVMVTVALYIALHNAFPQSAKRALGIFVGACGMLTTFWLLENPLALREHSSQIVVAAIGVVLAFLVFAKNSFGK